METVNLTKPLIDESGLIIPEYNDYLNMLINNFQTIYGLDLYLDNDSQDGQLIQILALAQADTAKVLQSLYQSFSPTYALGAGLSRLVKLNNIKRAVATYSTCTVTITGTPNTVIKNGVCKDIYGNKWNLPTEVTIPSSGTIDVVATADSLGYIYLNAGELTTIATPTRGWVSVTNDAADSPGRKVESDMDLRIRRDMSTMINAISPLSAIQARVSNLDGVKQAVVHENDTNEYIYSPATLPPHSICVVSYGGDDQEIAEAISSIKTLGVSTVGDVSRVVTDAQGLRSTINFYKAAMVKPYVKVSIEIISPSIDQTIISNIKTSLAEYLNTIKIGNPLNVNRLYSIVYAQDPNKVNPTFNILDIGLSTSADGQFTPEFAVNFNEVIVGEADNMLIVQA